VAYAQLAQLPPEFGLYSSFVGVMIYWFFATSKDITIGPVAVMSTLVGNIVADIPADQRPRIASALSLICGAIVFFIGLFRLGFIVDYIPLPAIAAFMTGSALSITAGQIPKLMGIKGFSTRGPAYEIFINTLKSLGNSKIDAAMGLSALVFLYFLRWIFTSYLPKKFPSLQKTWFFIGTLRTASTILLYTMISWLVNMDRRDDPMFGILGTIPSGFKHVGVPKIGGDMTNFASQLPAAVIVLLIEHIAISKSFGRINNYTIDPSQELVAIGITNIIGPFFGAYPATGSFSRTAIKSKAGVRTPFAGVITGVVVLLAIYCLTAVFFYIPDASLSAVIIHAVGDLITPPNTVYKFWRISPVECVIFFLGVLVTIFTNIENGIYSSVGASGALLLFRIAKARGHFMGKVKVRSVIGDHLIAPESAADSAASSVIGFPGASESATATSSSTALASPKNYGAISVTPVNKTYEATRNVFLPIDHHDGSNPAVDVVNPYPGVFVYRFTNGFLYPNASHYTESLVEHIFASTRRGDPMSLSVKAGDRAWNDAGPKDAAAQAQLESTRPALRAIILDFSSVNNVDITSVQNLLDVRNQLDRFASPDVVEWHFAAIGNRWTKRALSSAGFGMPPSGGREGWKPVFSVAEIGGNSGDIGELEREIEKSKEADPEAARALTGKRRVVPVGSISLPFFHVDLEGAVESAIRNVR